WTPEEAHPAARRRRRAATEAVSNCLIRFIPAQCSIGQPRATTVAELGRTDAIVDAPGPECNTTRIIGRSKA
ncbi:MAG TPA: hypothetical protein PK640_01530, partial [Verrucomicrobiota bacterium]|nr:hypothetical protein [Verrucomicrobiota bacterium]